MKYSPVDPRLRAYLLGELAEADRNAMETDIFTNKETFYRLSEVEDRLIDDYARDRLCGEEKLRFEQLYLVNPARRQRVEFALTMTRELDRQAGSSHSAANAELAVASIEIEPRAESRNWWYAFLESLREPKLAWAMATVSLALLVAGGAWLAAERARMKTQLDQARLEKEAADQRQRELENQLAAAQISNGGQLASASPTPTSAPTQKPSNSASSVFAFTLNVFFTAQRNGCFGQPNHAARRNQVVAIAVAANEKRFPELSNQPARWQQPRNLQIAQIESHRVRKRGGNFHQHSRPSTSQRRLPVDAGRHQRQRRNRTRRQETILHRAAVEIISLRHFFSVTKCLSSSHKGVIAKSICRPGVRFPVF